MPPKVGSTQLGLIRQAVRDGIVVPATHAYRIAALHASDRGILRRGNIGHTYYPTPLAHEIAEWHRTTTSSEMETSDTTTPPTGDPP